MMTHHRQQGMTLLGWVFLLAVLGFLVLLALRLMPAYMEYFSVVNSVKSVAEQSTAETPFTEMRRGISRRFQVNSISDVRADDIGIVRDGDGIYLHVDYEVRRPVMGNVDAIVSFERRFEVGAR